MITSRFAKFAVAVGAIGLAAGLPSSVQAADADATATATIATAITLASPTTLRFGIMVPDPLLVGTVVIDPTDDSRSNPGTIVTLVTGGTIGAAVFDVTGQALAVYSIDLPGDGVVTLGGPGTMAVDAFTDSLGGTDAIPVTGAIGTNDSFKVGATLTVGAAQAVGSYTGTFNVIVLYN